MPTTSASTISWFRGAWTVVLSCVLWICKFDDFQFSRGKVSYCLNSHNYARWNGGIIGQGGPTNDQFASLWSQLAEEYGSEPRIAFDIVNEPHDLDLNLWVQTNNAAVAAIRNA